MISQTNSFKYKLIANGVSLDLFTDEPIKVSNNITELFDISLLPSEITNDIALPGTKKNNEFFKHYYDISIENVDSYTTNKKIECYIENEGLYIINGYLMLNSLTINDTYIESYNITVYGSLSMFATKIKNNYLSDLTSLDIYNHNLNYENITSSWDYTLFEGNIIYPLADYGQKIYYTNKEDGYGIDEIDGELSVQDFKPAIKVKNVFDAIFSEAGYTYSSNFLEINGYLDNAYLFLNNKKMYPIFDDIELEEYGTFTLKPPKVVLKQNMIYNTNYKLPWFIIEDNTSGKIVNSNNTNLYYTIDSNTKLRGKINLNFKVTKTSSGKGVPQFHLIIKNNTNNYTIDLKNINTYFTRINESLVSQSIDTPSETYTLECEFLTPIINSGVYEFYLKYTYYSANNFSIMIDADDSPTSYLSITKQMNIADNKEIVISKQFPEIKQIDFIKSLQKKFNLIIYPSKNILNHFIIETWNDWYKRDYVQNFNNFIDLNSKIKITPANNLAYKKLTFKDKLDNDYISKTFKDKANREYGMEEYIDNENNYSDEELIIETNIASSPLSFVSNSSTVNTVNDELFLKFDIALPKGRGGKGGTYDGYYYSLIKIYSLYGNVLSNNNGNFDIKVKLTYKKYINGVFYGNTYKNIIFTFLNGVDNYSLKIEYNPFENPYYLVFDTYCILEIPDFCTVKTDSYYNLC